MTGADMQRLARAIDDLDSLSGGRTIIAIGIGHAVQEFEAVGVPFNQRGRMADEYLEAIRVLWTEDAPSFDGRFVQFDDVRFEPKPHQKPHPPIWIGGNSPSSLRRAARWQGWFPWQVTQAELPSRLADLRNDPAFGDDGRPFDVMMTLSPVRVNEHDHRPLDSDTDAPAPLTDAQAMVDAIAGLADIGVTWMPVPLFGPPARSLDDHIERLAQVASEVLVHFR